MSVQAEKKGAENSVEVCLCTVYKREGPSLGKKTYQIFSSKTKVMIFFLKWKKQQVSSIFEEKPLEIMEEYKYLGIVFHNRLSWETCITKRSKGDGELLTSFKIDAGN